MQETTHNPLGAKDKGNKDSNAWQTTARPQEKHQ
jgi:hypothetical protein